MQEYKKDLGKVVMTPAGKWDIAKSYDLLCLVYEDITERSYISKQYVPTGVDLQDSRYWMPLNVSGYSDSNIIILNQKDENDNVKSYSLEEAISKIAEVGRKPGVIIGFYHKDENRLDIRGRWEIWQFDDNNIYNWNDLSHWTNIYYNYNKFVGWFREENVLKLEIPNPQVGCYAFVGAIYNEAIVYRCDIKGIWTKINDLAQHYIKVIVGGNVTIGSNGNWYQDSEDTGVPASIKGDNGKTPYVRNNNNILEYSYDEITWHPISDQIAAWFRWKDNNDNTYKLQISRDNISWTDLSNNFVNNLKISKYIGADEALPTSGIVEGTIYMKGPTYNDDDTTLSNPIYRMWVYAWKDNTLAWQDNGEFQSVIAGIVQERGDSTTKVMSQDAVTRELKILSEDISWFNETKYYNEEEKAAYEEGLLECYIDSNKMPNITELSMWCYVSSDVNLPFLYISYRIANNEPVYLALRQPFSNINNFEQFNLFKDGEFVGYVIFKDKQKFIDNPKGVGLLFNLNKVLRGNMFNGFSVTTEKINDDAVTTNKIANKAITTEKIVNKGITIDKTNFIEVKSGNQLYDATSMGVVGSWYYWKSIEGIGQVVTLTTNQYTDRYTAIKIPINGLNKITLSQTGGNLHSYYIVDDNMKALDFAFSINSYLSGHTIDITSGAAYLLININYYNEEFFMANEGDVALPYEPYKKDTYINGIKITENVEEKLDISLPDTIYAVVGDTLQLFYRGMVKAVNPYNYDILVTCSKGNQYPRYYEFTPTAEDVGSVPFKVTIKDNNRNIIAEKSCIINVVNVASSPSSVKKIACFGDSLTTHGMWVAEVYRRLTKSGGSPVANGLSNIEFVGAKEKDGAGYYGVGGWTWDSYTTKGRNAYRFEVNNVTYLSIGSQYTNNGNTFTILEINVTDGEGNILCAVSSLTPIPSASGILVKSSGEGDDNISFTSYSQDSANPLWDSDANKMTFIPYANKYANDNIDIVYTLLSWNGLVPGMTDFSSIISNIKIFANTLHSEFPLAKLKIMGVQIPSVNGGMGANYGATGTSYADGYGMVVTALNMNKAYQDFANEDGYSNFVEFVNVSSQFDTDYNMPSRNNYVNTRSTITEIRGTNGVHPSNEGYMQIADIVYRNLMAELII